MTWQIYLNNQYWRTLNQSSRPSMNSIIELIDLERHNRIVNPETNIDQQFRLDVGTRIDIRQVNG